MLNTHHDIVMLGELRFLVPSLWTTCFEAFDYSAFLDRRFDENPDFERMIYSSDHDASLLGELEAARRGAVAAQVRATLATLCFLADTDKKLWGFKEIFNGSAGIHDWAVYDTVFPRAFWLHLIRDPLEFARSAAWHVNLPQTTDAAIRLLTGWRDVFLMSRQRAACGRYCEIRYEQLVDDPEAALGPVLERIGLSWDEECRFAMGRQVGRRSERNSWPFELSEVVDEIAGLREIMTELGYPAPRDAPGPAVPRLRPIDGDRWRICGPVWRENGQCWVFELGRSELAGELAAIADDIGYWQRSPLRLYEDGKAIGPPHALHFRIRRKGGGGYSHWRDRLLFSTSDNSNPNTNGRCYAIAFKS